VLRGGDSLARAMQLQPRTGTSGTTHGGWWSEGLACCRRYARTRSASRRAHRCAGRSGQSPSHVLALLVGMIALALLGTRWGGGRGDLPAAARLVPAYGAWRGRGSHRTVIRPAMRRRFARDELRRIDALDARARLSLRLGPRSRHGRCAGVIAASTRAPESVARSDAPPSRASARDPRGRPREGLTSHSLRELSAWSPPDRAAAPRVLLTQHSITYSNATAMWRSTSASGKSHRVFSRIIGRPSASFALGQMHHAPDNRRLVPTLNSVGEMIGRGAYRSACILEDELFRRTAYAGPRWVSNRLSSN